MHRKNEMSSHSNYDAVAKGSVNSPAIESRFTTIPDREIRHLYGLTSVVKHDKQECFPFAYVLS